MHEKSFCKDALEKLVIADKSSVISNTEATELQLNVCAVLDIVGSKEQSILKNKIKEIFSRASKLNSTLHTFNHSSVFSIEIYLTLEVITEA
jgi:hypothetical protein